MSGRGRQAGVPAPGRAERARDKVRNNKGECDRRASDPRQQGASRRRNQTVGTDGSYHSARKGWKHQEPLGEEHGWRHRRTGWYYIGMRGANRDQFNRASRTNCQQDSQPSPKASRMFGKGSHGKEQVPCPKCGNRVQ